MHCVERHARACGGGRAVEPVQVTYADSIMRLPKVKGVPRPVQALAAVRSEQMLAQQHMGPRATCHAMAGRDVKVGPTCPTEDFLVPGRHPDLLHYYVGLR